MKTAATVLAALIALMIGLISCTPPANSAESTPRRDLTPPRQRQHPRLPCGVGGAFVMSAAQSGTQQPSHPCTVPLLPTLSRYAASSGSG
jgi:hypothetical protein